MKMKYPIYSLFSMLVITLMEVGAASANFYDCPPEPESVTQWWCPWCKPKTDTTKLDIYNEIMDLYDGNGDEDAPKAITLWFGKQNGQVGTFGDGSDKQLQTVFRAAAAGNQCVRDAFEDSVCYTLHFSDIFHAKTLSDLEYVKALNTFRTFVLGVTKQGGSPLALANNARALIVDIIIPAMYKLIGGVSFMFRIGPDRKFELDLLSECGIH